MQTNTVIAAQAGPPREAPGVAYLESASAPGMKFFRCEPLRASMTMKGCGARWTAAQSGESKAEIANRLVASAAAAITPGGRPRGSKRSALEWAGADYGERQTGAFQANASLQGCRSCPIGAAHAGREFVHYSQWFGMQICPRCGQGGLRMIGNRVCVSCYNRARELRSGKNARGNKPVELIAHKSLRRVEFRIRVNGRPRRETVSNALGMHEPIMQVLRTVKGDVAFGFNGTGGAGLRQGRLL